MPSLGGLSAQQGVADLGESEVGPQGAQSEGRMMIARVYGSEDDVGHGVLLRRCRGIAR